MEYLQLAIFLSSLALSIGFSYLLLISKINKTKNPCFDYKLSKPAGYSLSIKANKALENGVQLLLFNTALTSIVITLAYKHHTSLSHYIVIGIYTLALIVSYFFMNKVIKKICSFNIGLIGEQSVGNELSLLMKEGYSVFHDLVDENKKFNIDHIVVADSGVFVVETKVRRKLKKRKPDEPKPMIESELNQVTFIDGHKKYIDYSAMLQAKRNAETLAKMISEDLAISVQVTPIVAFVGWLIQRKSQGEVRVVSGRHTEFRNIFNNRPVLSPRDRLQIEKWLAKQCMIKE